MNRTGSTFWQIVTAAVMLLLASCQPEVVTPTPTVALSNVRVTSLARLGKGIATDVAWSPDASMLALSSSLGVYLYDGQTLEQIQYLDTDAWETRLVFSPDGSLLASLSDEGIRVWRPGTGDLERILGGRGSDVTSIAFSPAQVQDDLVLAAGNQNGVLRLWQVRSGRSLPSLQGLRDAVTSLAFSADGSLIAAGAENGDIIVWSMLDDTRVASISDHAAAIVCLFFSSDDRLGSISADGQVRLWDMSHCAESIELCGRSLGVVSAALRPVSAGAFAPDDNPLLALGMPDGSIQLWWSPEDKCRDDARCWLPAGFAEQHQTAVVALAFSPDAARMVSVHQDNVVQLWKTEDCAVESRSELLTHTTITDDTVTQVATQTATYSQEAGCLILPIERLNGYTSPINSVTLMSDGLTLVSGYDDGKIRVWQMVNLPDRWTLITTWSAHAGAVLDAVLSPDSNLLASIGDDNMVRVWRLADGTLLQTIKGHTWPMTDIAFSADGTVIATAACDKTVKLWRGEDGTLLDALDHPDCVRSIDFSTDGQFLVTGAEDGVVRVWQIASGDIVHELEGHEEAVWSVAFSPDGQFIVSGSGDRTVRVWSWAEQEQVSVLKGHSATVTGARFSPDGAFVISGSSDSTMRVWQVGGGILLYTLNHNGAVRDIDVSDDGALLAAGVGDGTVRLWQMVDD